MSSLASEFDRIVFHFDGNKYDFDDVAALPVAAMLTNSADLQDKTTFFYNNNLTEDSNYSQVEAMRESAAFAEKLGIDTFDYQSNIEATTDKLVDIFNSGQKVLSIEGGPMEAVYRALEQTTPENRQKVTLLSHSTWNETHNIIGREGVEKARTWADLKSDFPEVTFLDIADQNGAFYNDGWNWLDNTDSPVFQEARDSMRNAGDKVNDPSDAGMLFYALTGNEYANPDDAKAFFDANPPSFSSTNPQPQPEPNPNNNSIVIQAEDIELSGAYVVEELEVASGGEVISLFGGSNDDTGEAVFEFEGATDKYDVKITYFDENDGVGQLTLNQEDEQLASLQLDQQLGSPLADEQTKTTLLIEDVEVEFGDVFQIVGIEQGSVETAEHLRVDSIEFIPVDSNSTLENAQSRSGDGVTRPSYNQSTGFFTLNGKLYDANGNEFVPRGVNNTHAAFDDNGDGVDSAYEALDNIAGFGANSVRITWEADKNNDALLDDIIERTIDLDMIPLVTAHDFVGSTDTERLLDEGVEFWTDRAEIWNKHEKHLMLNIANEFGDWNMSANQREDFPEIYKEIITEIRDAGINNTLVIDPFDWGKDYTLVEEFGQEIYNHDPQKNVVFDIHMYCGVGEDQEKIADAFDSITGQGIPMMIGEFADTHPDGEHICDIEDEFIMAQAEEHNVGYYAWAWNDWEPTLGNFALGSWEADTRDELTPEGQKLILDDPNGIANTSEIATIF